MEIYVQFSDASDTTIVSYFTCPQDPAQWPNQGVIDSSDPRYKTYYESLLPVTRDGMPDPT